MTLSSVKNEEMVVVGLGEMQVSSDPNTVLACLGLGSCIGISAYDPVARVGAMVHVVLPHGNPVDCGKSPTKYANTALPAMVNQMESKGAVKSRIVIKIAGGAKIIHTVPVGSILDIGDRNITAVKSAVAENKLSIKAEDIRGTLGRSMWLSIDTGITKLRTTASPVVEI
ncbi:MAG: chemotaxis protein CheD [Dehalococcoidia bacterium]